jgi:ApaG protein
MVFAKEISPDFQVSTISRFIPERSNQEMSIFFFAYWITIKNQGKTSAQLLNRYWHIMDADGRINEVRGEGVVGEKPLINPGKSFKYNSFCPLPTEFGFMQGYYEMQGKDKSTFQIEIPQFRLASPHSAN